MQALLCRSWKYLAVRGTAAALFGLAAMTWPGLTLGLLILLFGSFVLIDGVLTLVSAFQHKDLDPRWWVIALEGLAGVVIGSITLAWPAITGLVVLFLIAWWALITGVFEIMTAIRLRRELSSEWLYLLSGVFSVLFGLILLARPGAGALAVAWIIGFFSLLAGILYLSLAWKLRALARQPA